MLVVVDAMAVRADGKGVEHSAQVEDCGSSFVQDVVCVRSGSNLQVRDRIKDLKEDSW